MVESFIITLREGIEIALVVGILIVYLRKIGRPSLVVSVYLGLALALLASVVGGIILNRLAIDQEILEGYFLLAAALFVISMVVWMWVTARRIRSEIELKVNAIIGDGATRKAQIGILSFTFLMVVREGLETAVFLQAVAFSAGSWWSVLGTVAGIASATVFAVLFIRGSVRIDIGRFLNVTAITLLIFTVQLIVNAVHEFYEYGVFPASPRMMGILGPIVQNNVLFIVAIMSIPALMLLIPGRRADGTTRSTRQRRWEMVAGLASIVVILFLGASDIFSSNHEKNLSSEQLAIPASGLFSIPVNRVDDRNLHRFAIQDSGLEIRFFVLRTGLGTYATAFDACYACYSYGRYYLKGKELICSQCEAPTSIAKLRQTLEAPPPEENTGSMEGNGCAPIYLPSTLRAGMIEVRLADLRKQRKYFDISE
jgi:high-affinity iron transporter